MKWLHTSDWHLGHLLHGKKRFDEFDAFLDWLLELIRERSVDGLLVAGDIFDTTVPPNRARQQYYDFLKRVTESSCRHVVITGGNHDSPTFLEAPKELLKSIGVHLVPAAIEDNPAEEILLLRDKNGTPEIIVSAVPYLRERDVRKVAPGESMETKEQMLLEGITNHYRDIAEKAIELRDSVRESHGISVPIIASGHLFAAGGKIRPEREDVSVLEDSGIRQLYVGSLGKVGSEVFSSEFDYTALGHLHVPQTVGGRENIRYSGSPLPMNFGETNDQKQVLEVVFPDNGGPVVIEPINVPEFRRLEQIKGDRDFILGRLEELSNTETEIWAEIVFTGEGQFGTLREEIDELVSGTKIEVLRQLDRRLAKTFQWDESEQDWVSLEELSHLDVFRKCMDSHGVPEPERVELELAYNEILEEILSADSSG